MRYKIIESLNLPPIATKEDTMNKYEEKRSPIEELSPGRNLRKAKQSRAVHRRVNVI